MHRTFNFDFRAATLQIKYMSNLIILDTVVCTHSSARIYLIAMINFFSSSFNTNKYLFTPILWIAKYFSLNWTGSYAVLQILSSQLFHGFFLVLQMNEENFHPLTTLYFESSHWNMSRFLILAQRNLWRKKSKRKNHLYHEKTARINMMLMKKQRVDKNYPVFVGYSKFLSEKIVDSCCGSINEAMHFVHHRVVGGFVPK